MKGVIAGLLRWVSTQGEELFAERRARQVLEQELADAKRELAEAKEELKSLREREVELEYMHEEAFADIRAGVGAR